VTDDDLVPISVRLGEVVPPEDPEDWTRPLTWMAAAGMLAAPALGLGWFAFGPPADGDPRFMTWVLAATIAAGAALTGASQAGRRWAFAATLGAGLFAALATVIIGLALSGERQVGVASPTVAHAVVASASGLAGAGVASLVAVVASSIAARWLRWLVAAGAGAGAIGLMAAMGAGIAVV
jgi:hypothetical protein